MNKIFYLLTFTLLIMLTACEREGMVNKAILNDVDTRLTEGDIKPLINKKVYFGHQSVGGNVIEGLNELLDGQSNNKLNIIKSNNPDVFKEAVFAHSYIGENSSPVSKLTEFKNSIDNGIGNSADIAFLKFCYLDIDKNSNVDDVFSTYQQTFNQLENNYPHTKFVHVTVPLTVSTFSVRSLIKSIIGRPDNNIKRNEFNNKLIEAYGARNLVFNLAEIESTYPDGSRSSFTDNGQEYFSLAPEYASDNGHLNEMGRKITAKRLITFLSEHLNSDN